MSGLGEDFVYVVTFCSAWMRSSCFNVNPRPCGRQGVFNMNSSDERARLVILGWICSGRKEVALKLEHGAYLHYRPTIFFVSLIFLL